MFSDLVTVPLHLTKTVQYSLFCIDIVSKFLFVVYLKNKRRAQVLNGFKELIKKIEIEKKKHGSTLVNDNQMKFYSDAGQGNIMTNEYLLVTH